MCQRIYETTRGSKPLRHRKRLKLRSLPLFENAEHGPNASWIVRDIIKAYFDKKARRFHPLDTAADNAALDLPKFFRAPLGLLMPQIRLPHTGVN